MAKREKQQLNPDGCRQLAAAIVLRAVKDYRRALKDAEGETETKKELEEFFHSPWFDMLMPDIAGEKIMQACAGKAA